MRKRFEGEIDEILRNNFTNNKTLLKSTAHAHTLIIDWISCGSSTSDSIKLSILREMRSQNDCTFLFFNKHGIAYVSCTFYFMRITKMFRQNQKTVLKKNVYSSVSMDLRTVFKILQKIKFFLKQLRTTINANTDQSDDRKRGKKRKKTVENEKTLIQNAPKKQKTKTERLFE